MRSDKVSEERVHIEFTLFLQKRQLAAEVNRRGIRHRLRDDGNCSKLLLSFAERKH